MTAAERLQVAADAGMVEHALEYARRGWHVFPCRPADKRPYTISGFKDATTDEKMIRQWWLQWPLAMIGVRMGEASGVWAIDPDAPKDGSADGRAAWAALIAKHGAVHTHAHLTPGDGEHLLFKWDADRPITNREGQLKSTGINVRGEGGYVIAPPSRRQDGRAYEIAEPLDYFNIADAPDWLYDLILAKPAELSISQRAMALVQPRDRDRRPYAEAALRGEVEAVATETSERNNRLNTAAVKLGSLVGAGELTEGEVIGALYDASVANGYVASDGQRATMATINSGLQAGMRTPRQIPEGRQRPEGQLSQAETSQTDGSGHRPSTSIHATPYAWRDPATITRREWLYGYLLIRKFVSATVSPGGVGKSSLIAAEALAMTSGRNLLGVSSPARLRVWLWNLEDPQEETERKVQAAALHYNLTPDDIGDRLYVDSGRDQPLVIATTTRNGAMIARPVVDSLIAEIVGRQIDVVIIDPFVSSHEVGENDNQAMDLIVKEWGRVAERGNCAVHLVHHTRKMTGGVETEVTTESSRGGKALTDGCRVVRAVNRMSKDEGEKAGVENHRLYFRTLNDKANLQPPADQSDWFKLHSVDLPNGHLGGPGDSVGVVVSWTYPDPLAGITGADFDKAAAVIRGGRWRENVQAGAWVGKAIADALELNLENKADKAKAIGLLKRWLAAGSLIVVEGKDENREIKKFVEVKEDE